MTVTTASGQTLGLFSPGYWESLAVSSLQWPPRYPVVCPVHAASQVTPPYSPSLVVFPRIGGGRGPTSVGRAVVSAYPEEPLIHRKCFLPEGRHMSWGRCVWGGGDLLCLLCLLKGLSSLLKEHAAAPHRLMWHSGCGKCLWEGQVLPPTLGLPSALDALDSSFSSLCLWNPAQSPAEARAFITVAFLLQSPVTPLVLGRFGMAPQQRMTELPGVGSSC